MNFNYVRLHQMAYRNVARALYLGGGYNLDHHYNIVDKALDTAGNETQFSDHFVYSVNNKFPTKKYTTSGVVLGLLWDSRDFHAPRSVRSIELPCESNASWK
jgi:hypothetical protein